MKKIFIFIGVSALVLSACAPTVTGPTQAELDTAVALASEAEAEAETAREAQSDAEAQSESLSDALDVSSAELEVALAELEGASETAEPTETAETAEIVEPVVYVTEFFEGLIIGYAPDWGIASNDSSVTWTFSEDGTALVEFASFNGVASVSGQLSEDGLTLSECVFSYDVEEENSEGVLETVTKTLPCDDISIIDNGSGIRAESAVRGENNEVELYVCFTEELGRWSKNCE